MRPPDPPCLDCGASQPANGPAGLCPRCLLRLGLEVDLSWEGEQEGDGDGLPRASGGYSSRRRPPVEATGAFPPSGILNAMEETIGSVPRILLRDGSADELRPVKPNSLEMPASNVDSGRYQLLGEIARGGMGAVLKGRDVDLGRDLAVKVILEEHRHKPEMVRRFVEEAQIGGQLQHPGIVPVHELGRLPDGRLYIAMKLVRGRTLAALLHSRKGPADDRIRLLSIFEQVCQTMAYAHSRSVIHRDLKPSNVMVGNFGEVQVMDWGLAKVLDQGGVADERAPRSRDDLSGIRTVRTDSDGCDSRAGSVLGTPAYMAPEQARGELETIDERADVFGLGSILCEILTGLPAYTGRSSSELYTKAERAELDDAMCRLDSCGVDDDLVALVRACLAGCPADRPRDAGMVLAGLSDHLVGVERRVQTAGTAQAKAEERAAAEYQLRILTASLAASILATAMVAGGGWIWATRATTARAAKLAGEVNKALEESALLRGQARSDAADPAKWAGALAAARRARSLLVQGDPDGDLTRRVGTLLEAIDRDRAAAAAAEADRRLVERLAEIHSDFAIHLDDAKMDDQYVAAFRGIGIDFEALDPAEAGRRIAARPDAAELLGALDHWIFSRRRRDRASAGRLIAVSRAADPDPWRTRLRDAIDGKRGDRGEALALLEQLAESPSVAGLPGETTARLAFALAHLGNREKAASLLRVAQRAHPDDFWINSDLGSTLRDLGERDEAIRFLSIAVAIRPRSGLALENLGRTLLESGRLEDAVATFRLGAASHPENANLRVSLGSVLLEQGERKLAQVEFAEAIRLRPGDPMIRDWIAHLFLVEGDGAAAVAELRDAVDHHPGDARARVALGIALRAVGRNVEAITAFREAIRLDPRIARGYSELGGALLEIGDYKGAIEAFRRGESGAVRADRDFPWASWLRDAERLATLAPRLPALLRDEDRPSGADEAVAFARLAAATRHHADAARLWLLAFAMRPSLADDPTAAYRHQAAREAAMVGTARGSEDKTPSTEELQGWRRHAIRWLRDDLDVYRVQSEAVTSCDLDALTRLLGLWRADPAFARIRDDAPLSAVSRAERDACKRFWSDVKALQDRARRHPAPVDRHSH